MVQRRGILDSSGSNLSGISSHSVEVATVKHQKTQLLIFCLALLAVFRAEITAQTTHGGFAYIAIDVPGAAATTPNGINNHGEIVGTYLSALVNTEIHGFILRNGVFRTINFPGAKLGTDAFGVNNHGWIVGDYFVNDLNGGHGYVAVNGEFRPLNFPDASETAALGINDSGEIVGDYINPGGDQHGFRLKDGHFTKIDFPRASGTVANSINNAGEIGGFYFDTNGVTHGFLLSRGMFLTIDFPGASSDDVSGISSVDTAVGGYVLPNGNGNGYLLRRGVFHVIAYPGAALGSHANGVNDKGGVVGDYVDSQFVTHGFFAYAR
jgi:uncharacterized membrane protein